MRFRRFIIPAVLGAFFFLAGNGGSAESDRNAPELLVKLQASLEEKSHQEEVNPHFTGKYCEMCHDKTPEKGGDTHLKYGGDFVELCKCHRYTAGTYIHPVFTGHSGSVKSVAISGDKIVSGTWRQN